MIEFTIEEMQYLHDKLANELLTRVGTEFEYILLGKLRINLMEVVN
jgi:hypothetical protein